MKLFFSVTSPYVRKCLVSAHELGLVDRIELLPANASPVQRDATIVERNPLGKVPTFLTDDGTALYDSRVICEYLDDLGGGTLFPKSGAARWTALTLQSLADGLLDAALLARYEEALRPEALRWAAWRDGQVEKIRSALAMLDRTPGLLDQRVDIGTIAVACSLGYLDLRFDAMQWRSHYPQVAHWLAAFGRRPSMQAKWSL